MSVTPFANADTPPTERRCSPREAAARVETPQRVSATACGASRGYKRAGRACMARQAFICLGWLGMARDTITPVGVGPLTTSH